MDLFNKEIAERGERDSSYRPLADRMRPRTLDEFVGQEKIIAPGKPLRKAIESDKVGSIVFWGPPGTGKTTLAELIARSTHGQFVPFSAVSASIKEVKEILTKAGEYYRTSGRRTYVFIDEIHRFNKAQQDAFLPYVEKGDVILIGATTENPSFEVNSALLSRMRVYILDRLADEDLQRIVTRALADTERGLGNEHLEVDDDALAYIANAADGDGRRALTLLEMTAQFVAPKKMITTKDIEQVNQKTILVYDKAGDEHFNLISAFHKSIRGGDPDGSLYWLARMLDSGEDPLYIVRRMIRFASEDIGLADPYALTLCVNARDTYHFLGTPEGELAIAQAVIYMACAPKSNAIYIAYEQSRKDAGEHGSLPVPLWIRNAPTRLMKALDYGKGYKYAHEFEDAITDQEYFPEKLAGTEYYHPTGRGREEKLKEYLDWYKKRRQEIRADKTKEDSTKRKKSN
ncbi:MAG: replication-associated recombination protein A [candidate division Zixibacteria bacterium]|nr:replication-associated recombination protein A [candidate division Zixibacteria bacterium]